MSVWALLVAAGAGERLGGERPKAFVGLGRAAAARRAAAPPRRVGVDRRDRGRGPRGLGGAGDPPRRGARRHQGGRRRRRRGDAGRIRAAALAEVPEDALVVIVHDAARPLVSDAVLERVLAPLSEGWDGVVPGLPLTDTVKSVDGDRVTGTESREKLVAVQTPQAFLAPKLREAYAGDLGGATDCSSLVEALWRAREGRRGRPAPAEGDDPGRSRPGGLVAVKAFVFDVGETLVDETGMWERAADAAGVPRFTLMGVLGGLAARGEHHDRAWGLLGVEQPGLDLGAERLLSRCAAVPGRAALAGLPGRRGRQHARRDRGAAARARRPDRLLGALGDREARARVLRADRRGERRRRPTRSPTSATASTTTFARRIDAGMVAVHIRRGPWGHLFDAPPRAIRIRLARRAAGGARWLSFGSASASTRTRSRTTCGSSSAASRSTIRAGSRATRTAT